MSQWIWANLWASSIDPREVLPRKKRVGRKMIWAVVRKKRSHLGRGSPISSHNGGFLSRWETLRSISSPHSGHRPEGGRPLSIYPQFSQRMSVSWGAGLVMAVCYNCGGGRVFIRHVSRRREGLQ